MVDDTLILKAQEGALVISAIAPNWCNVSVQTNQATYILGAESPDVIASRLSRALAGQTRGAPAVDAHSQSLHWVITLNELHGSLYTRYHNDGLELVVEDADGLTKGRLELSHSDVENWQRDLRKSART